MLAGKRWLVLAALAVAAFGLSKVAPAKMGTTKAYITNSLGDDITMIDLATLKSTGTIKVGKRVHGICAQADGQKIFTTIESEKTLKVVDTATNEVTATIELTGRPNQCAATPDNAYNTGRNDVLWVSSMGDHQIDRIDLKKMEYTDKIPVSGIPRPYAVTKDEKTLYVALSDYHGFEVVSIPDKKQIAKVDLPAAPPADCALEPHTETHGLALSPNEKELWVTSLADGGVYVYDIATKKFSKEIATGECPNWIGFSPDGKYVTVSNCASNDAAIIDAKTQNVLAKIKTGEGPKRLLAMVVPQ